jgi:hypothetical protein
VSDSTYTTDTTVKAPRYLAAGVPEVWIVNISDHANPVVEVWTPGSPSQPTLAREVVSVAGIDVPLPAIFDHLADIPPDEELGTREGPPG